MIIRAVFQRKSKEECLIIIQCATGHLYGDLIACARYRVDDEREKAPVECGITHVLFVIHLPRQGRVNGVTVGSSFVSFQGGKWLSAHVDDHSESPISLQEALSTPISELFYNMGFSSNSEDIPGRQRTKNFCLCSRLYDCIQAAVAEMIGSKKRTDWATRVRILLQLIPQKPDFPLGLFI